MDEKPSAFAYVKKTGLAKRQPKGRSLQISKGAKYGYSNARVHAMKGLLLKKEFLKELARVRSVDAVVEMLERTYYKDNLVKLSMHYRGSDLVQIATAFHFAEIVGKLERIAPEADRKALYAFLTKWDIINAKSILNARRIGKKYSEVAPFLIPIGSFTESEIKGLLEGGGDVFLKFAKTHLGRRIISSKLVWSTEIEKLFIGGMGSAEMAKFEALLDSFYYSLFSRPERFADSELAPMLKIFRKEIDMKNMSIIARLKRHGITAPAELQKYFIGGGLKQFSAFMPVIEVKKEEEMLKIAAKQFELKNVPSSQVEFETMLNNKLASAKTGAFYRSVLSLGTILGFLFLKEEEINNLRKIAVGKEFGIPDAKIVEMLVVE